MKLGAIYSKEKTTFTLFSPVADSVFVIFYDKGNDSERYFFNTSLNAGIFQPFPI